MSKVKSPVEKKALAYCRDHVSPSEYPHGFRKTWPRKKIRPGRAARHKVRQILRTTGDDTLAATVVRKKVRKWGVISLRESVDFKKWKRNQMIGARKARQARRAKPS
ncbi:hypothetical protein [Zavarzinella formosa]|uniref:hypothetical protein n=1 Tax=Zavarzinella formosa TaxID=360055 RepID=UPI00030A169C|nr:hypothetical protein [Zavarzinella formosa]